MIDVSVFRQSAECVSSAPNAFGTIHSRFRVHGGIREPALGRIETPIQISEQSKHPESENRTCGAYRRSWIGKMRRQTMYSQNSQVRRGALKTRRLAPANFTMMLLAVSILIWPRLALGGFVSNSGSTSAFFGDDLHTSTLNPNPLVPVSTITYAGHPELTGQCTWINAGLDAFKVANPTWSYSWAGVTQEAVVEKGISLVSYTFNGTNYSGYNPFVVSAPQVTGAPGSQPTPDNPNGARVFAQRPSGEVGGAVLNLQYKPQAGAPAINNLHWIQAYTGTIWGHALSPILDNDPANPYKSQGTVTPFYDQISPGGGTLAGGGGFFEDRPQVPEFDLYYTRKEYESNPVASIQFQVVLADFNEDTKHITLYGGEWWGFTYSAVELPEPSSCLLMTLGGGGLLFLRRMTRRMRAA